MDFKLNEEQLAFRNMAYEFAQQKLFPFANEWDEKSYFPIETLKEAAALGMAGIVSSEEIGGTSLKSLDAALIFEQLATGCISTSTYLSIHNMVTSIVDRYAPADLRLKFGPKLTSMTMLGSYCLTEPNYGSDAASLQTKAIRKGNYYIVNGTKAFISGGSVSDLYVCLVRTGAKDHTGISCLLIEKDTQGLSFGNLEKKMGWKSQPTTQVYFENCLVPITNRIGEEGVGFKIAINALNEGRVNIAACSLGAATTCLKLSQDYLHQRKQFGKPLSTMQSLRFYFADMLTELEAARLMVYRAALSLDIKDNKAPMYCAMAKRFATDVAFKISDKTMQLHGGYGYLHEYQIERIFRDLRVHQILEGTNEIMRELIAKNGLDKNYIIN